MRKIVVPFQRGEDLMKTVGQLYVDLNKAKDVLLDMEKVRGLIYRESLASCKDLSLEEALRAADGPRFGGTAPVDLLTELRPYEGGPEHFTLNTMVVGLGGYKFNDYVKSGLPLILVSFAICMVLLPILYPFYP